MGKQMGAGGSTRRSVLAGAARLATLATLAAPAGCGQDAAPTLPPGDVKFVAVLTGAKVRPPTASPATGRATFLVEPDGARLRYRVTVSELAGLTSVGLRLGEPEGNGPLVAMLHGPAQARGMTRGLVVEAALTADGLIGEPPGGRTLAALVAALRAQAVYVEIDTAAAGAAAIRGQVHSDRRRPTDL